MRLVWGALALIAAATPALAGVKDGVEAWSRGDYAKAVAEWRGPAAQGDADAQFNLAQAYKLGRGVPTDLKKAEELYAQAAKQGHLPAADTYGLLLFQSGRRAEAMRWLLASAERGEPRAQYVLGIAHYNGDLVERDPVRAYALMTRAAATGLESAKATLATMDQSLSLDERQRGVALAAKLEAKATQQRATELASGTLRDPVKLVRNARTGQAVAAPLKKEPVTAGADFAAPVTLGAAPAKAPPPVTPAVARAPATTAAKPPAAKPASGDWRVQLGAFGVPGNAQGLWAKLKGNAALAGRQPFYVPAGKLTKLQAGPFATRAEAQAACASLGAQACIPVAG